MCRIWLSPRYFLFVFFFFDYLNKFNIVKYLIALPSFYAIKGIYYEWLITVCDKEYSFLFMQITALRFYFIRFDPFDVDNKIIMSKNKLKTWMFNILNNIKVFKNLTWSSELKNMQINYWLFQFYCRLKMKKKLKIW